VSLPIAIVDAFTRTPGAGNRAGIAPDAAGMDDAAMQRAAAAVAASETAFLLPPPEGVDVRLRYFTPSAEIPFCGHATVATFHWLAEQKRLAAPGRYRLDCPGGRLEIELERAEDGVRVWMETPQFEFEDSPIPLKELVALLGGSWGVLDPTLPVQRAGYRILVPVKRRADLWALLPRWDLLMPAIEAHGMGSVYVFTRDALEPGNVAHGRYFAPGFGIREDPVTGSATGVFAGYLARHGVLSLPSAGGVVRSRVEQGDVMGKPGRLDIEVSGSTTHVERARVGGVAVTILEGTLV
jgi:PhzF family phenazine biosynthesis protein